MNPHCRSSLLRRLLVLVSTATSLLTAASASAADTSTYPTEIIHRPLTLPGGMVELTGSLQRAVFLGFDATGLGLGASYGINNKVEVSAATGFGIDPDVDWGKSLALGAGYSVVDTAGLDLAIRLAVPLDFDKNAEVLSTVSLGADTRLQLTPKLALRAGQGLLQIYTDPSYTMVNGNVAVEFQASPQLGVGFGTQLFSFQLTGDGDFSSTIADVFPFRLYGLYAVNHALDVFASFSTVDTGALGDFNVSQLGVNFRL